MSPGLEVTGRRGQCAQGDGVGRVWLTSLAALPIPAVPGQASRARGMGPGLEVLSLSS